MDDKKKNIIIKDSKKESIRIDFFKKKENLFEFDREKKKTKIDENEGQVITCRDLSCNDADFKLNRTTSSQSYQISMISKNRKTVNTDAKQMIHDMLYFPLKDILSIDTSNEKPKYLTLTERIRVPWTQELSQLCHNANNIYNFGSLLTRKLHFLVNDNSNVSYDDFLKIKDSIMPDESVKDFLEKKALLVEAFDKLKRLIKYQAGVYSKFESKATDIGNLLSTIIKNSRAFLEVGYAQSSQQICRHLGKNWYVYFKNLKTYYEDRKKPLKRRRILDEPKIPRYRKERKNYEFTMSYSGRDIKSQQFKAHIEKTRCTIRYKKYSHTTAELILPPRHRSLLKPIRVRYNILKNLSEVRIVPRGTEYEIEIVYKKRIENANLDKTRIFAIDLGVNNHMTLVANFKFQPLLISSSPLKRANYALNSKTPSLQRKRDIYQDIFKRITKSKITSYSSIVTIIRKRILTDKNDFSWKQNILTAILSDSELQYEEYLKQKNLSRSDVTMKFFGYVKDLSSIYEAKKFLQYHLQEFKARKIVYTKLLRDLNGKLEPVQYIHDNIEIENAKITVFYNRYKHKSWDAIHKLSCKLITLCKEYNVGTIIIGYNKGWKQCSKLSKAINRKFVSIPFYRLKQYIQYKAKLCGIRVIVTEEWYTLKCSAIDREPIGKREEEYDEYRRPIIEGRDGVEHRHKGLFYSDKSDKLIHGDVNGAYNIGRREAKRHFENIPIEWMLKPPLRVVVV
jgi:IS605 OrfB family transposase